MRVIVLDDARYARFMETALVKALAHIALDRELRGNDPHPPYPIVPDGMIEWDAPAGQTVVTMTTMHPDDAALVVAQR